jgi:hypothetical protein
MSYKPKVDTATFQRSKPVLLAGLPPELQTNLRSLGTAHDRKAGIN